jgi:hypothetical protein
MFTGTVASRDALTSAYTSNKNRIVLEESLPNEVFNNINSIKFHYRGVSQRMKYLDPNYKNSPFTADTPPSIGDIAEAILEQSQLNSDAQYLRSEINSMYEDNNLHVINYFLAPTDVFVFLMKYKYYQEMIDSKWGEYGSVPKTPWGEDSTKTGVLGWDISYSVLFDWLKNQMVNNKIMKVQEAWKILEQHIQNLQYGSVLSVMGEHEISWYRSFCSGLSAFGKSTFFGDSHQVNDIILSTKTLYDPKSKKEKNIPCVEERKTIIENPYEFYISRYFTKAFFNIVSRVMSLTVSRTITE